MGFYQMTLTIAEIERISKEIRDYFRAESVNLSIQRIKMNFYEEVEEALDSLNQMANDSMTTEKIDTFRRIMDKKEIMEKNLKNFLLKRYEKLMRDSLFEISSKTYEPLAPPEKKFIMEMHNQMDALFRGILTPGNKDEQKPVVVEEDSKQPDEPIEKTERSVKSSENKMIVLSVTADYIPVATSFSDFYLHRADIVYLPEDIANILKEKKYAREIKELN